MFLEFRPPDCAGPLPTLILLHGYSSRKEDLIPLAEEFVARGFAVLLFDAALHGEHARQPLAGLGFREQMLQKQREGEETLAGTLAKLDEVVAEVKAEPGRYGPLGLWGVSMGGCFVWRWLMTPGRRALVEAAVVTLATPLMGESSLVMAKGNPALDEFVPSFEEQRAQEADLFPELLGTSLPLLLLNGTEDPVMPIEVVRKAAGEIQRSYADPGRLVLREYPGLGHQLPDDAAAAAGQWFTRYCQVAPPPLDN